MMALHELYGKFEENQVFCVYAMFASVYHLWFSIDYPHMKGTKEYINEML